MEPHGPARLASPLLSGGGAATRPREGPHIARQISPNDETAGRASPRHTRPPQPNRVHKAEGCRRQRGVKAARSARPSFLLAVVSHQRWPRRWHLLSGATCASVRRLATVCDSQSQSARPAAHLTTVVAVVVVVLLVLCGPSKGSNRACERAIVNVARSAQLNSKRVGEIKGAALGECVLVVSTWRASWTCALQGLGAEEDGGRETGRGGEAATVSTLCGEFYTRSAPREVASSSSPWRRPLRLLRICQGGTSQTLAAHARGEEPPPLKR